MEKSLLLCLLLLSAYGYVSARYDPPKTLVSTVTKNSILPIFSFTLNANEEYFIYIGGPYIVRNCNDVLPRPIVPCGSAMRALTRRVNPHQCPLVDDDGKKKEGDEEASSGEGALTMKIGGSSSSIKCPMLTKDNYTVWAIRMKVALKVNKVWEAIEIEDDASEKNNMAIALLFQSIPESLILQVGELDTAKAVWEAIKTRYVGAERVKEARLQTLMAEFDRLKMKESDTIDSFV